MVTGQSANFLVALISQHVCCVGREPGVSSQVVTSPGPSSADIENINDDCSYGRREKVHDLVGRILGQQHTGQQSREKKPCRPQTEEQRGNRACALAARGSMSKAMKELVGGAAIG